MKRRTALIGAIAGLGGILTLTQARGAFERAGWRHGWWGRGRHGGFARLCAEGRADLDPALARVKDELAIRAAQEPAWDALTDALRAATTRMAATCASARATANATLPGRLTQTEAMLASGLGALREARPAFDALYDVLGAAQRRKLDDLVEHGTFG